MGTIELLEQCDRELCRAIATLNQLEGFPNFALQQIDALQCVSARVNSAIRFERNRQGIA